VAALVNRLIVIIGLNCPGSTVLCGGTKMTLLELTQVDQKNAMERMKKNARENCRLELEGIVYLSERMYFNF
jgi:hypothetical protein